MPNNIDKAKLDIKIRAIQEWILEDWPDCDIILQIQNKWDVNESLALEYLTNAKDRWINQPSVLLEDKRKIRIESLKRLKRSLKIEYKGTPEGIKTILQIEREIIQLEHTTKQKHTKTIKRGFL